MLDEDLLPGSEEKIPFYVHCGECCHEWIAVYTPVSADLFGKFVTPCIWCHSKNVRVNKRPDNKHQPTPTSKETYEIT